MYLLHNYVLYSTHHICGTICNMTGVLYGNRKYHELVAVCIVMNDILPAWYTVESLYNGQHWGPTFCLL